jgi:hypothetical protein
MYYCLGFSVRTLPHRNVIVTDITTKADLPSRTVELGVGVCQAVKIGMIITSI